MFEAQALFRIAPKLSRPEKAIILGFIAGNRENPYPEQGDIVKVSVNLTSGLQLKLLEEFYNTGYPKSLGHILTLNMSKTIKEITTHLIYSESLQSQVFYRMFKDVQCEHT